MHDGVPWRVDYVLLFQVMDGEGYQTAGIRVIEGECTPL
jgi:hypothetical protein